MYEAVTINVSGAKPEGMGRKKYAQLPRIGEWVEVDEEGMATVFEVIKVTHSSEGHGCDIYVKRLGPTTDLVKSICTQN